MDFLCDIPNGSSEIFYNYDHILRLLYLPESIILNNLDFFTNNIFSVAIVSTLSEHGGMSYLYFGGPFGNTELRHNSTVFYWISFYIFGILLGFILDLIFYFLGKYLSNKSIFKNLKFNSKKFFYIFFRFIPIIGNISVFIGSILDKNHNKNDFFKIFIGNFLFILTNFLLGFITFKICGWFWM